DLGRLEAGPEDPGHIVAAAAAGLAPALLSVRDLRRDGDEVAREPHPDAARRIEEIDRVRRAVAGQREDALVDGPERDLGALAAAGGVADGEVDPGHVARAVLGSLGTEPDVEALDLRCDAEVGVSDPERRTAGVVERAGRCAPAADDDDRDEDVRR